MFVFKFHNGLKWYGSAESRRAVIAPAMLPLCKILSHALSRGVSTLAADGFIFTLLPFTRNFTRSDANLVVGAHLPLPSRARAIGHVSIRNTQNVAESALQLHWPQSLIAPPHSRVTGTSSGEVEHFHIVQLSGRSEVKWTSGYFDCL